MTFERPIPSAGFTVRPLSATDLASAAELHVRAFPGFFLSSLGVGVLKEFYRGHQLSPRAVAFTARDDRGRVVGVVTGTMTPDSVYREMLTKNPWRLLLSLGLVVLRRPSVAPRMVRALTHGAPVPWATSDSALLNSICVDPSYQGRGVGLALMEAWVAEAETRSTVTWAYLTTDANDNDAVRAWYERNRWVLWGTFARVDGRQMAAYRRRLVASSTS